MKILNYIPDIIAVYFSRFRITGPDRVNQKRWNPVALKYTNKGGDKWTLFVIDKT